VGGGDPQVLEALVRTTGHADRTTAFAAVNALGKWPRLPVEVAGALVGFFRRFNDSASVLPVLGKLERPTPEVLAVLRRFLRGGREPGTGYWELTQAATTLAEFGPAAAPVIPELARAAREATNPFPARALVQMGDEGVAHLCAILPTLTDEQRQVSILAALSSAGAAARPALPHLRALLNRQSPPGARRWAIQVLGAIGPPAAEAIPDVLRLVAARDYSDSNAMSAALRAFGEALVPFAPRLVKVLHDSQRGAEHPWIIEVVGSLARFRPPLVGELREALRRASGPSRNHSGKVRLAAIEALGDLKGAAAEAVPELLPLVNDPDVDVRRAVVEALGEIGEAQAVQGLCSGLRDADDAVRATSAEGLGRLGEPAAVAAADLVRLLGDRTARVRREAATALGRLGANTPEVLAGLQKAAEDADKGVRGQAAQALRKLQARKKR
jgi:HEAT repeat protein